ncbi:MAG: uroporphyrinogen decarboxylase family protein [Desulfuromonadaceae bacterium]|nr:uroporphyrinogen decarboxylase family protein [Desulfuromonadaceae bacterium]
MNSYQRVMGTLTGQLVDRPPVFAVLGAYGGKQTNTDLRTLYSDASAHVAGQKALQDEFGFDLVMTAFDFSAISEALGGETAWSIDQAPNMRRPAARNAEDALSLPLPDPEKSGRLPVILEGTRQLAAIYKGRVPIISVLPGPGILPSLFIGMEQWMETVLFDRDTACKLLNHSGHFFVAWANALLAAGADCLVVTEGMASAEIAPRSLFADQILPHLSSTFAQIQGPKVLHHTGGRINHTLDLLSGLDGLVGFGISSKDDLTEARRLIGPDLNLIGNLDNLTLPVLSAGEVYEMSLASLRIAAPCGHYILCNSAADIPLATPPENLRAMLAAAAAYSSETGCRI